MLHRITLLFALSLGSSSLWATIMLTPADCGTTYSCWTSPVNSQPTADSIETLVGTSSELLQLYKSDQGGSDSGSAAGWYDTSFFNSPTDPEDALIEWLGGSFLTCGECYLSVKDGNSNPSLYVFDISSWDGKMDIDIQDFWPNQGGISNVAIWGTGTASVPAPAPLSLLALGLLALYMGSRQRRLPAHT